MVCYESQKFESCEDQPVTSPSKKLGLKKKKKSLFLASFLSKYHPCCVKCLSTFIHTQLPTPPSFGQTSVFVVKSSVSFQAHLVIFPLPPQAQLCQCCHTRQQPPADGDPRLTQLCILTAHRVFGPQHWATSHS